MELLYIVLYIVAAICFIFAAADIWVRPNLLAMGLFFWVLVPLIVAVKAY